jgi:hypothetical protein
MLYGGDMNPNRPTMTKHAAEQARTKGFTARQTWLVMVDPDLVYPSNPRRFPGQERRVRDGIVAVVDKAQNRAITFYVNLTETDLRPDQIAKGERKAS